MEKHVTSWTGVDNISDGLYRSSKFVPSVVSPRKNLKQEISGLLKQAVKIRALSPKKVEEEKIDKGKQAEENEDPPPERELTMGDIQNPFAC